ncbi:hypothetical protein CF15_00030 [Pyrodictium occultum]|uniref:Uncharacterized protein n=1 Tax=Pyrodictium occultum TaxID=2309 RepID=A0A0V8RTA7_PYROC|nr:hypothetical protein [Pyrodictium occultum]KSW11301.1 hypothetical protein CF15_00030 [Pyrodictium occultum]
MLPQAVSLEPPRWLQPLVDYSRRRLESLGYRAPGELAPVFAAIPPAHATGYEELFDYVVEAYYDLKDSAGELPPTMEPRFKPWLHALEEEVEALAAFEERLADSSTVFHAEPILAAAVMGLGLEGAGLDCWPGRGLRRAPGQQTLLMKRDDRKVLITVPSSLHVLAAAGLHAAGVDPPGSGVAVLPDPAAIRRAVMEMRLPLEEAAGAILEMLRARALEAAGMDRGRACGAGDMLVVEYRVEGPGEIWVKYLC